jgi:thioredoxin reductase
LKAAFESGSVSRDLPDSEATVIVGSGPAGLFAAQCPWLKQGSRPYVIERGQPIAQAKMR